MSGNELTFLRACSRALLTLIVVLLSAHALVRPVSAATTTPSPIWYIAGTPYLANLGFFQVLNATFVNNLPYENTGYVFAVVNNARGQTVLISTAALTLGSFKTGSASLVLFGLPHGTYSIGTFALSPTFNAITPATRVNVTL
jgi:hypothetical protein